MQFRLTGSTITPAVLALALATGCTRSVSAQAALSQAEAEKQSSNIYMADCHPPQPTLTRTVVLGKPNPNGHIREQYGPVLVYPVQVTWSGSCSGHPANPQQTDFYENLQARYTASYYKDQFGNWAHTPFVGSCSRVHAAYQPAGSPRISIPNAQPEGCRPADTVNEN